MTKKDMKKKIILPLAILVAGFGLMELMVLTRRAPEKKETEHPGPLVNVLIARRAPHRVEVSGTGTVQARQEARIAAQVSGRVVYLAKDFIAGGYFRKGDLLLEIESIDYELVLEQRKAEVARAEYELATVESQARVAGLEWERLSKGGDGEPNPLVLYEPQLKNARAILAAAEAAREKALLDLERTKISAPFDCRVRSEQVDRGQFVVAGAGVAVITGTNTAEVIVPLPLHELQWLEVPRTGRREQGSGATVRITVDRKSYSWQGRVVRGLGEVDPQGRMARLVVSVDDPYGLKLPPHDRRLELAVGMFVEFVIQGRTLPGVIAVPVPALRRNSSVWVVDDKDRLVIRPVEVIRREQEMVLISEGLRNGERVILTNLTGAANGMKVRLSEPGGGQ
ncbi:MAG: efflux RND transporter periplasmic adaptor subunit [Gemmatimonadota bacterium]|nr:efflux RND transporter periplasmic adaptor subunit [Gemmatimonadota bacterium]